MNPILYNVTVKVDHSIKDEWLAWMKEVHIPEVMATACFRSYKLSHLMGYDDEDGITFAIQYEAPGQNHLEIYQRDHAAGLQEKHKQKFEGKFVAFRTLLEVVQKG